MRSRLLRANTSNLHDCKQPFYRPRSTSENHWTKASKCEAQIRLDSHVQFARHFSWSVDHFPTQVGDWSRRPISKALNLESHLNMFHLPPPYLPEGPSTLRCFGCLGAREGSLAPKTQRYRVHFVPSFFLRSNSHLQSFFQKFPVIAGDDEPDRNLEAVWNQSLPFCETSNT